MIIFRLGGNWMLIQLLFKIALAPVSPWNSAVRRGAGAVSSCPMRNLLTHIGLRVTGPPIARRPSSNVHNGHPFFRLQLQARMEFGRKHSGYSHLLSGRPPHTRTPHQFQASRENTHNCRMSTRHKIDIRTSNLHPPRSAVSRP